MKLSKSQRCIALALALLLTAALPVTAMADTAELTELVATDITLDETRFEYTGQEIRPNVTVRVNGTLLTLDRDYTLEFKNNVEVGTAAVAVTGIPEAGYTGTVEHPFYIDPRTTQEDSTDPVTIVGTDVTIDGTEFVATGEAIEPGITVTVAGKELTAGEDYTLVYENNVQPGTASVTVTGVADKGYTGSVTIHFTIQAAPTEPEETQPEETKPEETKPVVYKITKGNGAIWRKGSGKDLSFTADGSHKDLTKVLVGGKAVNSKYYTVEEGTVVTLKAQFLQSLQEQKHTLTLVFADGEAEGTFQVGAAADDSNPKTGDSIHLWTALLFVTLTGIVGTAFVFARRSRK